MVPDAHVTSRSQPPPQPARRRALVGPALLLVCLLHTVVGLIQAGPQLLEAASKGWAGAFTGDLAVVHWFLMTGFVGLVAAVAITRVERFGPLPWSVSLTLLVVALIGVSMAPTSGFVLVLVVAILAVVRSARDRRSPTVAAP